MTLNLKTPDGENMDVDRLTCPQCKNYWYVPSHKDVPSGVKFCPFCGVKGDES